MKYRLLFSPFLVFSLLACSDDSTPNEPVAKPAVVGIWVGSAIDTWEEVSGELTLNVIPDGHFAAAMGNAGWDFVTDGAWSYSSEGFVADGFDSSRQQVTFNAAVTSPARMVGTWTAAWGTGTFAVAQTSD